MTLSLTHMWKCAVEKMGIRIISNISFIFHCWRKYRLHCHIKRVTFTTVTVLIMGCYVMFGTMCTMHMLKLCICMCQQVAVKRGSKKIETGLFLLTLGGIQPTDTQTVLQGGEITFAEEGGGSAQFRGGKFNWIEWKLRVLSLWKDKLKCFKLAQPLVKN